MICAVWEAESSDTVHETRYTGMKQAKERGLVRVKRIQASKTASAWVSEVTERN